MPEMCQLSLSLDEVRSIKEQVTHGASYAGRISIGFAIRLIQLREKFGEDHQVLHEIDVLEGLARNSYSTKEATQFRPPLHPFWHKHFATSRHTIRNMGERWALGKAGNRDLSAMIEEVAATYGDQPDLWPRLLVHRLVVGGLEERVAAKRMTGDWIIFAKHSGKNFYLDLSVHEEATHADRLLEKLRLGSACEFPFLFQ
ncbi:hypothetical protein [Methylovirgula sp. HY1]|uniref:hypothetical protein n=1 Tax=Methylovirgula sp. HY1 TaxID=2822761 RepID=UPI001C5AA61E|nr:hypothetical protein [Methylovirgula sp. HY1]QXX75027.1 hypothetical protein MHY1_01844 [Methylovirgula sp. HY1]